MRVVLIAFSLFAFQFLSGQCPDKTVLWKRITYLRDSSGASFATQLGELAPYLQKMKDCPYRNDSTHALLLQRIGALHFLQKDFVNGILFTRQSIDLHYKHAGSPAINQKHLIKNYNNLRICYDSLGQYSQRMEAIDSCIAVAMRLQSGYEFALPLLYPRIVDLFATGDYYRCISFAIFSEKLARDYGYDLDNQLSYLIWGINAMIFVKQFAEADLLVQTRITECNKAGATRSLGSLYSLLATITQEKGDIKNALIYYKKAFAYSLKSGNRNACAGALNNIGYLLYMKKLRQYDIARHYFFQALGYANNTESLNILGNIANTYSEKGDYDSAFLFFQKALDQVKPGFSENDLLQHTRQYVTSGISEYTMGVIIDKGNAWLKKFKTAHDQNNLAEAIRIYKIADRLFINLKEVQSGIQSRLFWRANLRRLYENAIDACFLANNTSEAFYFFERSRAVLLNDQLNEGHWLKEGDILEQAQLKKTILQLEREAGMMAPGSSRYNEIRKDLITENQELEKLRTRIKQHSSFYYQNFIDTTFITIPDVRKNILKEHSALLELFTGDSAVYSLLITDGAIHLDKINKADCDDAVYTIMNCISNPVLQNTQFGLFVKKSAALYQLIFRDRPLPEGRIIISTDGYNFPFEALVTNNSTSSPSYFITDHAVSYTYSARYLLNSFPEASGSSKDFLGVAPVHYATSFNLPSLGGSDQSLQKIKSYFTKADNLLFEAATKDRFLQSFSRYKILQLYTHAADSSAMGEPVIFFADSALYLSDLINESIPFTSLVILSACETGTGKLYQGEGVFSFNRGFAAMGIPSAIGNLWPVDNLVSYKLTEIFYKYVAGGDPVDIALQKAKLEFIKSDTRQYTLPYCWASATLVGKTNPVTLENRNPYLKYIIFFTLLAITVFILKRKYAVKK